MANQEIFTPTDIKWIKSVTRDKGKSWAYMEYNIGDTFPLNFSKNPKWYPTNYLKAKPKEIIAIFQTLLPTEDYQGGSYLTHLVSPIDENIVKLENENDSHPYTRMVALVATSSTPILINSVEWSFFKCNRGQVCNINTIERRSDIDFSIQQKQNFIWNLFDKKDPKLINNIPSNENEKFDFDFDQQGVLEGQEITKLRLHKFKERNPEIIGRAKEKAKRENRLFCEVCLFNFETQYPELGNGFIECHHKQHISKGGVRETKIEDLAIVCSNCHRMLHRKDKKGNFYVIEDLQKLINKKMN